jgi:hypothetical protein
MSLTIREQAKAIQSDWPRLNSGSAIKSNVREDLRTLAFACGLSSAVSKQATDADLIGIYRVALADPEAAKRTASKVQARFAQSPVFGDPTPAPVAPTGTPDLEPLRAELARALETMALRVADGDHAAREYADDKTFSVAARTQEQVDALKADLFDKLPQLASTAVAAALRDMTPTRLEVKVPAGDIKDLGLVHRETAKIIRYLARGVNVYLYGPAGSGKTTVARKCAEAFGQQFYAMSKVEDKYELLGFTTADGKTVRTPFREAYEHGGLALWDEFDASGENAVTALNMAIANKQCPFPDALVTMHPDFKLIAAGNTKLSGADHQYTGRNALDRATVDRFAFLEFGYDTELERALATRAEWVEYVQSVRAAIERLGVDCLVSPRATIDGCNLLDGGEPWDEVEMSVIFKGLDAHLIAQIKGAL